MNKMYLVILLAINLAINVNSFGLNVEIEDDPKIKHDIKLNEQVISDTKVVEGDNLCASLKCSSGEQCMFIDGKPSCECVEQCETPTDPRLMVCSSSNKTYESECHFYREKCWCSREDNKCLEHSVARDTLDYFGECQAIHECTKDQKEIFPTRIKQWLDEVLSFLAKTNKNSIDFLTKFGDLIMLAAQKRLNKVEKYWTYGVVFEFCQLDKSHDGIIEIEELSELIAPIKALESCIQPFLKECDADNDTKITDVEWGKCLDLSDDDLQLLRTVCKPHRMQ